MKRLFLSLSLMSMVSLTAAQHFRLLVDESDMTPHVEVIATEVGGIVSVQLQNHETYPVQCRIKFDTGAERRTRRTGVEAGEKRLVTYSVTRPGVTQKVRIHATCDVEEDT